MKFSNPDNRWHIICFKKKLTPNIVGVINIQINFHNNGNIGNEPNIFCEFLKNLSIPYTQTITFNSTKPIIMAEILAQ